MSEYDRPPDTATGVLLHGPPNSHCSGPLVVPIPSAPSAFAPQQYASPAAVRAQVWPPPMLIFTNRNPRETALGNIHELADPSPTFPVEFSPQQNAHELPLKPQLPPLPALTVWYAPGETTSTVVVSLRP